MAQGSPSLLVGIRGVMRGRGNMDNRGGMVGSSMIRSSMMDLGGKKGGRGISSTMRNISRCMYFCSILFRNMISFNSFRSSMRLANYRCYTSKVRFKYMEGTSMIRSSMVDNRGGILGSSMIRSSMVDRGGMCISTTPAVYFSDI